jgi:hypothetical protein
VPAGLFVLITFVTVGMLVSFPLAVVAGFSALVKMFFCFGWFCLFYRTHTFMADRPAMISAKHATYWGWFQTLFAAELPRISVT